MSKLSTFSKYILLFAVKDLRWASINQLFDGAQIKSLQDVIDAGATVDQVSDLLLQFGAITHRNKEEAIFYVFTLLLKCMYRKSRII